VFHTYNVTSDASRNVVFYGRLDVAINKIQVTVESGVLGYKTYYLTLKILNPRYYVVTNIVNVTLTDRLSS